MSSETRIVDCGNEINSVKRHYSRAEIEDLLVDIFSDWAENKFMADSAMSTILDKLENEGIIFCSE